MCLLFYFVRVSVILVLGSSPRVGSSVIIRENFTFIRQYNVPLIIPVDLCKQSEQVTYR